ncbi:hypothetical protein Tco_0483657 [Tanacetum coccineum]
MNACLFSGISIDNLLILSHLFFADDAIFVGKWDFLNIFTIVYVLKCFHLALDLEINFHKSKLIGIGTRPEEVDVAATTMGCSIFTTPFVHLGVKVRGAMSRLKSWDDVGAKVSSSLSKWKLKTISIEAIGEFSVKSVRQLIDDSILSKEEVATSTARVLTTFQLKKGKESNFDQLYAYLKQHLVHANENRTMMERFLQPTNDPLALELLQQKTMIESFSNHTLPSSHIRTNLIYLNKQSTLETVRLMQGVKFVVQDVRGRYNANNQGKPFQRNNARGNVVAGNVGGQNRGGINPGQAKPNKCNNYNGLRAHANKNSKPCSWEKISHLKIQSNDEVVPHMTQILLLEEALEFNSFLKDQESRTSDLKEKYNVIEDYETFASLYGDEEVCEPYNAKAMSHALIAQLRTHKSLVFTSDSVKPKVLAPGMYAIDVKPIPHPLKNNRSAHLNYISHLKESVENNSEIVEKLE